MTDLYSQDNKHVQHVRDASEEQVNLPENVPESYICPISNKVMEDPVIVVRIGKIYDRSSIENLSDSGLENDLIVPASDLKQAIQDYFKFYTEKFLTVNDLNYIQQLQEIEIEEQENDTIIASQYKNNKEVYKLVTQYQEKCDEVKELGSILKKADYQMKGIQNNSVDKIEEFKKRIQEFLKVFQSIKNININYESQNIWNLRMELIRTGKECGIWTNHASQVILAIYENKREFEPKLVELEEGELELQAMCKDLERLLTQNCEVSQFTYRLEFASKQYREPKKIDENNLREMFQGGDISYVAAYLSSNQKKIQIDVHQSIQIKGLKVINSRSATSYLVLNLKSTDINISFEDCEFQGIGLLVNGTCNNQKSEQVLIKGYKAKNSKQYGLCVQGFRKSTLENVNVRDCGLGVMCSTLDQCNLQSFCVENCVEHGVVFVEATGQAENGTVKNCKKYGIYMSDSRISGQNVISDKNGTANYLQLCKGGFVNKTPSTGFK